MAESKPLSRCEVAPLNGGFKPSDELAQLLRLQQGDEELGAIAHSLQSADALDECVRKVAQGEDKQAPESELQRGERGHSP